MTPVTQDTLFQAASISKSVTADKVYETLIDEFRITDWPVDELLNSYILTFCAFCKPRNGAITDIEEFRSSGFKIGLVSNGKTPFQERNFRALGFKDRKFHDLSQ